jgi:hypothetical protein
MCPPPDTAIYVPPLDLSVRGGADASEKRGMRLRMRGIRVLYLRGGADAADADADAAEKSDELTKPLSDELTKLGGPLSDNTLSSTDIRQHTSAYFSRSSLPRCRSSFTVFGLWSVFFAVTLASTGPLKLFR